MSWKIVERRIGKAGNLKQRSQRQREWDKKYNGNWTIGYIVDGEFMTQEEALEKIYYASYKLYFEQHPDDLEELIQTAKTLRNPHAIATGGVDLQVPAIMQYLDKHGLELKGKEVVDIGTFGARSHKLSVRLSPLTIKAKDHPKLTLEQFWQKKKCLAIWEGGSQNIDF
ncbi:MAG: hypothetical protein MK212_08545 [Saprospiraceae bacterium]|nr:hypothetical protein [Saprospiraceae bacterium]